MYNSSFDKEFFKGNRQKLRELFLGTAPIVITANGLVQKNADETLEFSQDSNFWYLTGIDEPNLILVMDKNKEYIIVPEYSEIHDFFDGKVSYDTVKNISGIEECYSDKDGWKILNSRIKKSKHLSLIHI